MSVWTNPSLERSTSVILNTTSELAYYARLTISALADPGYGSKDVLVFPGMEYKVKFVDSELGVVKNIVGLVEEVYANNEAIKFTYIENDNCTVECSRCNRACSNKNNTKPIPICNCILNPPSAAKYKAPKTVYIPICNIIDISFNRENMKPNEDLIPQGGTRVMILGISATAVRAIVIHLEFFDDCLEDAVKYVDLAAGNIYDIAYKHPRDNTIYEIRGKLISVQECIDDEACKPGKGFVRETTGFGDSVISTKKSKTDFMQAPPVKKVKLIMDTSEDFSGRYETIMLDSIRDCNYVSGDADSNLDDNVEAFCSCCQHRHPGCEHHSCGHFHPVPPPPHKPMGKTYLIGDYKVTVEGDKVCVDGKNDFNVDMSEVLKFYLGVE